MDSANSGVAGKVSLNCDRCGTQFARFKSQVQPKNYCCWDCFIETRKESDKVYRKSCAVCGSKFERKHNKGQVYCSNKCAASVKRQHPVRTCPTCNGEFQSSLNRQKYCCRECKYRADSKRPPKVCVNCEGCGKSTRKHQHQVRDAEANGSKMFCSHACRMRFYASGERNSNWKGGVTSIRKRIRELSEYKAWQLDILKRDKYTCQLCGERGGVLDVHHAIPFAKLIESAVAISGKSVAEDGDSIVQSARSFAPLWNRNNGITVCRDCHGEVHGTKRKR